MDSEELGKYTEAIVCLKQLLSEGRKSSNVDIRLMLSNIERCSTLVQDLLGSELDTFFSTALSGLSGSLIVHTNTLREKIERLNQAMNQGQPSTSETMGARDGSVFSSNGTHPDTSRPPTQVPSTASSTEGELSKEKDDQDYESRMCKGREQIIHSTIRSNVGTCGFIDVIGLTEAKQSLHDAIIMPLEFPHLFSGSCQPWRRILLYGPPGTGKTRLAQAVSAEVKATFYSVSSADLVSSLYGESEKLVKELFHHACSQAEQSIIFIDEIDSLCRLRSSHEDEGTRRIKTELLIQMEKSTAYAKTNIFLLCATNCPWDIDKAFLRRFQKRIYIPLPDRESRVKMAKHYCRGNAVNMTETDWDRLASETEGYSGCDISTLVNGALLMPIRELQIASRWRITIDGKWTPFTDKGKVGGIKAKISDLPPNEVHPREVTLEDFMSAIKLHSLTVPQEELTKFATFTTAFGQTG